MEIGGFGFIYHDPYEIVYKVYCIGKRDLVAIATCQTLEVRAKNGGAYSCACCKNSPGVLP